MFLAIAQWRIPFVTLVLILHASTVHGAGLEPDGVSVPSLSRVLERARAHAPSVVLGRADIATARSALVGARLPPLGNPYLEVVGVTPTAGASRTLTVDGTLWLPFEVAGQRGARVAEARALIDVREHQLSEREIASQADAVGVYGYVSVAAERVRLFEQLLGVSRSEAASYEARFEAGDATLRDARLAELELVRYRVFVEESRADLGRGLSELGRLTGDTFARAPETLERAPLIEASDLEGAPSLAVSRAQAAYYSRAKDRLRREGESGALSLMLTAGRDALGAPRLGGGVAYAFPVVQRNQGEVARADAERARALTEEQTNRRLLRSRLRAVNDELRSVKRALDVLAGEAEPAAAAAVEAAIDMQRAGKSDLFPVLTSRREVGLLRLRELDLVLREWTLASELVQITGRFG